jgi:serine/threonine-protein kinase
MAPEQVKGHPATARSDIYSTGASLYRAITGRRPFDGENNFQIMRAHLEQAPIAPRHYLPSLPHGLSEVILRSLEKDPNARYRSADDFRHALEPYLPTAVTALPDSPTRTMVVEAPPVSNDPLAPTVLQALEQLSARWLGPIASALVRRHSAIASNLPDLCTMLAGQIDREPDRRAFLTACARQFGPDAVSDFAAPRYAQVVPWEPALIERAKKKLVKYLGPLASTIVDRAAREARTVDELCAKLAAEIPSARDREAFTAAVRGNETIGDREA